MTLLRWMTTAIASALVAGAALCAGLAAGPQLFGLEPVAVREAAPGSIAAAGDLVLVAPKAPVEGQVLAFRLAPDEETLSFYDAVMPVDDDADGVPEGYAADTDGDGFEDAFVGAHQVAGHADLQAPLLGWLVAWAWPWALAPGALGALYFLVSPAMSPRADD